MEERLNYRIHNPNSEEQTARILLGIFVEANEEKIEDIIKDAMLEKTNMKNEYTA